MFYLTQNRALISKFNMAEHRGASISELKEIQLEISSSYGVDLSEKVFRVVNIDHFIKDFKENTFTLPQISTNTWGPKSAENPLSKMKYTLEDGTKFTINMHDYFGSCWSLNPDPEQSFKDFGLSSVSIRIESTVKQILSQLINVNDKFYSLHYHVGPIMYGALDVTNDWFCKQPYDAHLDPGGRGLAQSLLILPNDFMEEKEVRFIYLHQPAGDEWVKNHVKIESIPGRKLLCRHPFNWANIVNGISFDNTTSPHYLEIIKKKLMSLNIDGSIKS